MKRPRLLDLFCSAGGASMGYYRAGFEVVGCDIEPQPRYPFEFIQGSALDLDLSGFDAIAASPPCQRWSRGTLCMGRDRRETHPDLVAPIRARLVATGVPYIIENVEGAPLLDPIILDGMMFGLQLIRRRLFESNIFLMTPRPARRPLNAGFVCVAGSRRGKGDNLAARSAAMGIDWMTMQELTQAIPPAYTEFLGRQLMQHIARARPGVTLDGPGCNLAAA